VNIFSLYVSFASYCQRYSYFAGSFCPDIGGGIYSETSIFTRATWSHIPEDGILHKTLICSRALQSCSQVYFRDVASNILRLKTYTKNVVFWDMTPYGSCKNRSFGGIKHLHRQGDKRIGELGTTVARSYFSSTFVGW
jgi:hypothetical protein